MKPIIGGKGIIAKLGDKVLTKEQLHRLPSGVKDKVRLYSDKQEKPNTDIIKGITEWATMEELSEQLGAPLEDIKKSLDKQIAKGFIEEKDGKFRVNDRDGKGKERITNYLNELEKGIDEKMTFYDSISQMVKGGIYDAIKKGWIEFMDGRTYTADEWKNLNDIEKERIKIKLTEKGRREIDDNNPLKIYDELAKKKREYGGLNLVRNVIEKNGEIQLELTEEGMKVKQMGIVMGINPDTIFKTMLNIGLDKEMSKFMIVESDKIIDGSKRSILKTKSI